MARARVKQSSFEAEPALAGRLRMTKILGRPIWDWFRACGACGAAFGPVDFFCERCWREFRSRASRGARLRRPVEDFAVFSPWLWSEENDVYLRPLIYSMKGGWGPQLAENFAEDLSFARASLPARPASFCVTLPPRKPGRERDHAWALADGFARLWRAPLWDGLQFDADPFEHLPQKRKTAAERRQRRFRPCQPPPPAAAWTLVDDVVTSGATARAVYEALGRPSQFEVWALAARPPAAEIAALEPFW